MKNTLWMRLLLACALSVSASGAARAQAVSIGIIDEDKLAQGYTRYRDALVKLDKLAQELDSKLQARELLQGNEARRFDELVLKETRATKEDTELDALDKKGRDARARFLGLTGKVERTTAENAELENMNGLLRVNSGVLRSLQDRLYESIKTRQSRIDQENTDRANKVIEQVAADKKLALVWRKRAVIWNAASIDITSEVLSRLNKS